LPLPVFINFRCKSQNSHRRANDELTGLILCKDFKRADEKDGSAASEKTLRGKSIRDRDVADRWTPLWLKPT